MLISGRSQLFLQIAFLNEFGSHKERTEKRCHIVLNTRYAFSKDI